MITSLFSPEIAEPTKVPKGMLSSALQSYQRDLQTGLVLLEMQNQPPYTLFFVRGNLATVYRGEGDVERLDERSWLQSLDSRNEIASLRTLSLTHQDLRIFKILIEQSSTKDFFSNGSPELGKLFPLWRQQELPALAVIRWPSAEALVLLPGHGAFERYSIMLTSNTISHFAGSVREILDWKEPYKQAGLISSASRSLAWQEYLLHSAFSKLVQVLLEKAATLIGRVELNQIMREVNFKAAASDWNLSINGTRITDQTFPANISLEAEMYATLLGILYQQLESFIGDSVLRFIQLEALHSLNPAEDQVIKEYLPVALME